MNENVKNKLIETAASLFLLNGIKSVTMDDIAHKVGISKRTLYETFRDKDELLTACLAYNHQKGENQIQEIVADCKNSIEILLRVSRYIIQRHHFINPCYFKDMRRYHPVVLRFFDDRRQHQYELTVELLNQGVKEGMIRPELNVKIIAMLLQAQVDFINQSYERFANKFTFPDILETMVENFARGVASKKGLEMIQLYLQEHKN